jgi:glucose-6-phosphate isomerase
MKFDYTNILKKSIGESGISEEDIKNSLTLITEAKEKLNEKLNSDYFPLKLPFLMSLKTSEIIETAEEIRKNFDNFVVVGMGGSSLGNQMLHFAFKGLHYNETNRPRVYFLDNVDPLTSKTLIESLDLKKTIFNIITKSGTTAETMENFLFITDELTKSGLNWKEHVIFTTDPEKGLLRKIASKENIKAFEIPENVGGRYSVLTPVGLLSAAVEGIDIPVLLRGAELMRVNILNRDPLECSAMLLPLIQYLMYKKKSININAMFTYSDGLSYFGQWYRQLLSESIGKRKDRSDRDVFTGITPLSVRGTTDQHSILQLFLEGPFDKLLIMIAPEDYETDIKVEGNAINEPEISYLKDKEYSELIKAEFYGTQAALKANNRPFITITIPKIREEEIGKLIYLFEYATILLGEMLNINPIDQPAVELGKAFTYGIMGKEGFETKKEEMERILHAETKHIITFNDL